MSNCVVVRDPWHNACNGANAPPKRNLRAAEGRSLAKSGDVVVSGEGRDHRASRPRGPCRLVFLQAAIRDTAAPLRPDKKALRLCAVLASEYLRERRVPLPVLLRRLPHT